MSEYTPTTEGMRNSWIDYMTTEGDGWDGLPEEEAQAQWDRWLAARDSRIRAEVIDYLAGRIRSIPHWWDADMEVSRAVEAARAHFGLTKGADCG